MEAWHSFACPDNWISELIVLEIVKFELLVLYFGSIRMNILMLDTRNVEQT